jgi:hypothetical protein
MKQGNSDDLVLNKMLCCMISQNNEVDGGIRIMQLLASIPMQHTVESLFNTGFASSMSILICWFLGNM